MPLSPNADAGNKFIFHSKNLLCWVHCTAKEDYWKMCNWRKNPSADFTQQRDSFRYKLKALHLSNLMFWSGAHQKLFSDTYEHTLRQSSNRQLWERNNYLFPCSLIAACVTVVQGWAIKSAFITIYNKNFTTSKLAYVFIIILYQKGCFWQPFNLH